MLKAFNSPNYLEDLTGLSDLYVQTYDEQVRMIFKIIIAIRNMLVL